MIDAQQLPALQMTMVVVVDVVVDMVVAAAVVAEETLEGEEAVAEVEGVLLAGLATGPAPAAATTALLASKQPANLSQQISEAAINNPDQRFCIYGHD